MASGSSQEPILEHAASNSSDSSRNRLAGNSFRSPEIAGERTVVFSVFFYKLKEMNSNVKKKLFILSKN